MFGTESLRQLDIRMFWTLARGHFLLTGPLQILIESSSSREKKVRATKAIRMHLRRNSGIQGDLEQHCLWLKPAMLWKIKCILQHKGLCYFSKVSFSEWKCSLCQKNILFEPFSLKLQINMLCKDRDRCQVKRVISFWKAFSYESSSAWESYSTASMSSLENACAERQNVLLCTVWMKTKGGNFPFTGTCLNRGENQREIRLEVMFSEIYCTQTCSSCLTSERVNYCFCFCFQKRVSYFSHPQ